MTSYHLSVQQENGTQVEFDLIDCGDMLPESSVVIGGRAYTVGCKESERPAIKALLHEILHPRLHSPAKLNRKTSPSGARISCKKIESQSSRKRIQRSAKRALAHISRRMQEKYRDAIPIYLLGGVSHPTKEVRPSSAKSSSRKPMQRIAHYFLEPHTIKTHSGKELHVDLSNMRYMADEWRKSGLAEHMAFNEYLNQRMETDPKFRQAVEEHRVRYFSNQERHQTLVTFDAGIPKQIGLDSPKGKSLHQLEAGVNYAFVLGDRSLFMSPKGPSSEGKVQHSSFLRGAPVRSAGIITVDESGKIATLRNYSGHYAPNVQEIREILYYLKEKLEPDDFRRIQVSVSLRSGWRIALAHWMYDHLHIKWGIVTKPADLLLDELDNSTKSRFRKLMGW